MGQINRIPFGYLSLLDSQNFGRNPTESSDLVSPTIDIYALLAQDRDQHVFATSAGVIIGGSVVITVPANECWDVQVISCRVILGPSATNTARFALKHIGTRDTSGQATVGLAEGPQNEPVLDAVTNAREVQLSWNSARAYIARPGDQFTAVLTDAIGAPFTVSMTIKRRRFSL